MSNSNEAKNAPDLFKGWNDENTAIVISAYNEADPASRNMANSLIAIGSLVGNTNPRSVRSKLSNEKVYQVAVTGEAVAKKAKAISKTDYVRSLEKLLNADRDSLDTLVKANKTDLALLTSAVRKLIIEAGGATEAPEAPEAPEASENNG